jgi:hypothetical protein
VKVLINENIWKLVPVALGLYAVEVMIWLSAGLPNQSELLHLELSIRVTLYEPVAVVLVLLRAPRNEKFQPTSLKRVIEEPLYPVT